MGMYAHLFLRLVFVTSIIWSGGVYAVPPHPSECINVSVTTDYESIKGKKSMIPAGSEYKNDGPIGRIMGSFRFTCRPHFFSHGSTAFGVFLARTGASYRSGSGKNAEYNSNINGLIFKLPPNSELSNLIGSNGMVAGTYGGEGNAIMVERYPAPTYNPFSPFTRTFRVPIFHVYKIADVPISNPVEMKTIWLRHSPVEFGSYWDYSTTHLRHHKKVYGPAVNFYDPSCMIGSPVDVMLGAVAPGDYASQKFNLSLLCGNSSFQKNGAKVALRFEPVTSSAVSFSQSNPTVAHYAKDGVKIDLRMTDINSGKLINFGEKLFLNHNGNSLMNIPFQAQVYAFQNSKFGPYEIDVNVTFEYN